MVKFFIGLLIVATIFSCSDESESYSIGDMFNNPNAKLGYVDTLSVNGSTVLLDSFITSGFNKVFVGNYENEFSGEITAQSYISFGLDEYYPLISDEAVFDSLLVVALCNFYPTPPFCSSSV